MRSFLGFMLTLAISCIAISAQERVTPTARPEDPKTQADFQSRISKYYDLRNKLGGKDTRQTESAQEAKTRQEQLAAKVREARATAKRGDIFSPQISELFQRDLRATYRGQNGKRIQASLAHAEPTPKIDLQVNATYPASLPLQSTPATILMNLPRLPKGLEYRLVGRDLILYDSATNMIVDFLPEALPSK